ADLPSSLDGVLEIALAKQPADRYATGASLAASVRTTLSDDHVAGDAATRRAPVEHVPPTRTSAGRRRPRTLIAIVLLAALVAIVASAVVVTRRHGDHPATGRSAAVRTFVDR